MLFEEDPNPSQRLRLPPSPISSGCPLPPLDLYVQPTSSQLSAGYRVSPGGTAARAARSSPLRRSSRLDFNPANDRFTWSKSFRRAILLVTSSWARSSFSCSSLMLASCSLRFSLCRKRATARGGALVTRHTSRNEGDWRGKTGNDNRVNFGRCKKEEARVAQEGRTAVQETTVS